MKSIEKISVKRIYKRPEIVCAELDNKISLALESNPPFGPDEISQSLQSNQISPFQIDHT